MTPCFAGGISTEDFIVSSLDLDYKKSQCHIFETRISVDLEFLDNNLGKISQLNGCWI
jgi:hypothetical protein